MPSIHDRFFAKVNKTDTCWLWTGFIDSGGRGRFYFNGRATSAHRVSYELFVDEILEGLLVCHRCDVSACVNPDHLFVGTQTDNMHDCSEKGRTSNQHKDKTHCINGHEYTARNTYLKPDGYRDCRECLRMRSRKYARRKRAI